MTIEKHLNRIEWRMTNEKFTPNQKDKEAVEALKIWINEQKSENIKQNELFAKAFCYLLMDTVNHYNGAVDLATQRVFEDLNTDISIVYEKTINHINFSHYRELMQQIGIDMKRPGGLNALEREILNKNSELVQEYQKGIKTLPEGFKWLNSIISEAVRMFKNKKTQKK